MGKRLQLALMRAVTDEEWQAVGRVARARAASVRAVERARVVQAAPEGATVEEIAAQLQLARNSVDFMAAPLRAAALSGVGRAAT